MENKKKIDDQIMKKLDANNIRRPICLTNKGALELVIVKGGNEYYLTLDSVPVEKELNRELMDILFKPEVPQVKKEPKPIVVDHEKGIGADMILIKKKGRPAKVKSNEKTI